MEANWISVKDRLPNIDDLVLTFTTGESDEILKLSEFEKSDGLIYESHYYWTNHDEDEHIDIGYVTHWMPLPAPPLTNH